MPSPLLFTPDTLFYVNLTALLLSCLILLSRPSHAPGVSVSLASAQFAILASLGLRDWMDQPSHASEVSSYLASAQSAILAALGLRDWLDQPSHAPEVSAYLASAQFAILASLGLRDWMDRPPPAAVVRAEVGTEQEPLTKEEEEAVVEAKGIVGREREKFLRKNNGSVPFASGQLQSHLDEAMKLFEVNVAGDVSSEGKLWVSRNKNGKREIEIFSAEFPKHACKRWKVRAVLKCDLTTAYDAVFDPEIRRTWDDLVKDVQMLQIKDCDKAIGDGLAITLIVTNAAAGGLVSSRCMLDLALQKCHSRGGIIIANTNCPSNFPEFSMKPEVSGSTVGTTHIGSGCSIRPIPGRPGYLEYILVSTIDLGGWLPQSVITAAMSTSLMQGTEQMLNYLEKNAAK